MDPLTMGLITGGASLLGSIFTGTTSASNTQAQIAAQQQMLGQTENFNAEQSQIQRDYETQMSNTAYQRASADMQKAGLNPMMMFGSGSAAGTPSVGAASVGTPSVPMPQRSSPLAGIGDAVSRVFSTANAVKDLQQKQAEIDTEHAKKVNLDSGSHVNEVNAVAAGQRIGAISDQNAQEAARATIMRNQATTAANQAAIDPTFRKYIDMGAYTGQQVDKTITPVVDTVNTLTSSALKRAGQQLLQKRYDLDASKFEETYGYHPSDRE